MDGSVSDIHMSSAGLLPFDFRKALVISCKSLIHGFQFHRRLQQMSWNQRAARAALSAFDD